MTLLPIGIRGGNTAYVDIPANQTYAVVTITPHSETFLTLNR